MENGLKKLSSPRSPHPKGSGTVTHLRRCYDHMILWLGRSGLQNLSYLNRLYKGLGEDLEFAISVDIRTLEVL